MRRWSYCQQARGEEGHGHIYIRRAGLMCSWGTYGDIASENDAYGLIFQSHIDLRCEKRLDI